jgi:hypothetical protein
MLDMGFKPGPTRRARRPSTLPPAHRAIERVKVLAYAAASCVGAAGVSLSVQCRQQKHGKAKAIFIYSNFSSKKKRHFLCNISGLFHPWPVSNDLRAPTFTCRAPSRAARCTSEGLDFVGTGGWGGRVFYLGRQGGVFLRSTHSPQSYPPRPSAHSFPLV